MKIPSFLKKLWPFKKKTNVVPTTSTNDIKLPKLQTKKQSKIAITCSCVLGFFVLGAGAVSTTFSALDYKTGSDFGKSYNIRWQLDKASEDPFDTLPTTTDDFEKDTKASADAYSKYLHEKGIDNINVYPETIKGSSATSYENYINATVPNKQYYDSVEEEDVDCDPTSISIGDINSSRLTAVFVNTGDGKSPAKVAILPLNDYIMSTSDSVFVDSSNKNQVDIHLTKSFSDIVENWLKVDTNANSNIYIVQDYNSLVNYMTYILQADYIRNNTTEDSTLKKRATSIYDSFTQDETTFITDYKKITSDETRLLSINEKFDGGYNKVDTTGENFQIESTSQTIPAQNRNTFYDGGEVVDNNSILTIAPLLFGMTYDDSDGVKWTNADKINYSFMKNYILSFGVADNPDADSPVSNSFLNVIPSKKPTDKKVTSDWRWLTIDTSSRYVAQRVVNQINNGQTFTYPILINNLPVDKLNETDHSLFSILNRTTILSSNFNNAATQTSALLGLIISICTIILAIGILVSILYRIPGLFGFLSSFGASAIGLVIFITSGVVISLSLLCGFLTCFVASIFSVFILGNKVKRFARSGIGYDLALKKGIKASILPILDIHIVLLLIGCILSYFGATQVDAFGNFLIIGSLLSLGLVAILWVIQVWLFANNRINMTKPKIFIGSLKNKKIYPEIKLDNKNYLTSFTSRWSFSKLKIFDKKLQIVLWSIIGAVILTGIILMAVLGISLLGNGVFGGYRLIMTEATYNAHINDLSGYTSLTTSDGNVYLFYQSLPSNLTWISNNCYISGSWVSIQSISVAGASTYMTITLISLLIVSAILSSYAFIRLNWVSLIPSFLALTLPTLFAISFILIVRVPIDTNTIFGAVIFYTINAIMVFSIINTINNKQIRKNIFSKENLRSLITTEVKSSFLFYLEVYLVLILCLLIACVFNSTTITWFWLSIIIMMLTSIFTLYVILPITLYFFISLRYRYLSRTSVANISLFRNYDKVDEQLINGINNFKK